MLPNLSASLFAVPVLAVRSAVSCLFSVFEEILDAVLIDEEVRAAAASELDAIAVIPLDGPVENFTVS
jgi:hypothetical protein